MALLQALGYARRLGAQLGRQGFGGGGGRLDQLGQGAGLPGPLPGRAVKKAVGDGVAGGAGQDAGALRGLDGACRVAVGLGLPPGVDGGRQPGGGIGGVALEQAGLGVTLQFVPAIPALGNGLLGGGEALGALQLRDPQPRIDATTLSCFYDHKSIL